MSNKKTEVPVKTTKISLLVQGASSKIIRGELPFIYESTEKAVEWIAANGFKAKEVELIGEKPSNWDSVFPPITETEVV